MDLWGINRRLKAYGVRRRECEKTKDKSKKIKVEEQKYKGRFPFFRLPTWVF
jgi:hypothetical protein